MNSLDVKIKPVLTKAGFEKCQKAALANNHDIGFIDHAVIKNNEIIGTFATVPLVVWWMHTEKSNKIDSLMMFNALDTLQREQQNEPYFIVCETDSPYLKLLQKYFEQYLDKNLDKPAIFMKR